jgi:hypothetical protein
MYSRIFQDILNGTLNGVRVMPQKDSTSDGTNSFAMDRHNYMESYHPPYTNAQIYQKKWLGGNNRDASQITRKNRVNVIGVGSMNTNGGLMSFTTHKVVNTVNDALRRVRAGGYVAPPKIAHNKKGFTPVFPVGPLIRTSALNKYDRCYQSGVCPNTTSNYVSRNVQNIHPKSAMFFKPISYNRPRLFH